MRTTRTAQLAAGLVATLAIFTATLPSKAAPTGSVAVAAQPLAGSSNVKVELGRGRRLHRRHAGRLVGGGRRRFAYEWNPLRSVGTAAPVVTWRSAAGATSAAE